MSVMVQNISNEHAACSHHGDMCSFNNMIGNLIGNMAIHSADMRHLRLPVSLLT